MMMRERFHTLSILRRSCAANGESSSRSQGIRAAFSTGSTPITTPTKNVIRPPGADKIAHGQKEPRDNRPSARGDNPTFIHFAPDEGGHREGVRHGETDKARIQERRVSHHVGIFKQRVEAATVERHGKDGFERIGDKSDNAQKECRNDGKNH